MKNYLHFVYLLVILTVSVNAKIERPRGVSISSKWRASILSSNFLYNQHQNIHVSFTFTPIQIYKSGSYTMKFFRMNSIHYKPSPFQGLNLQPGVLDLVLNQRRSTFTESFSLGTPNYRNAQNYRNSPLIIYINAYQVYRC